MASLIGPERTFEIHLHAPEDVRRERDPSGAHAAVERGTSPHLPGITTGYEPPEHPDLAFDTSVTDLETSVDGVLTLLLERGVIDVHPTAAP